jgi:hypothetical protein
MANINYVSPKQIDRRQRLASALVAEATQSRPSMSKYAPLGNALMGIAGGLHDRRARKDQESNQQLFTQAIQGMPQGDDRHALAAYLMGQKIPELQTMGLRAAMSQPAELTPYQARSLDLRERELAAPKQVNAVEGIRRKLAAGEPLSPGEQRVYDDASRWMCSSECYSVARLRFALSPQ